MNISQHLQRGVMAAIAIACLTNFAMAQDVPVTKTAPIPDHPLTLAEVVERAQQYGLSAQAAENARESARWRDRAFGARLLPRLSMDGTIPSYSSSIRSVTQPDGSVRFIPYGQTQSSMNMTLSQPIPALGAQAYVGSGLSRVQPFQANEPTRWQSNPVFFGIQQEIFRPRTLWWDRREQDIRADLAERQFHEAREDVASRAAAAYFDLYASQVAERNAIANASVNDSLYTISKGRYEVGKIGENDLLQSELALLRARASVDAARLESERALAVLRLELNLGPEAPLTIAPPPAAIRMEVQPEVAVAEARRNVSAVTDVELQRVQAKRRVSEARLNNGFNASVRAQMGYNQTASLLDDVFKSPLEQKSFELGVQVPLVQWGAGRYAVRSARADEARIGNIAQRTEREIANEAHFAARSFAQAQRQLEISAKADTVATKRFDVAKDRYVIGRIAIDNLFIAQNEKDAASLAYVQAVRNYWLAYYRLRRLTLYDFQRNERIN